MTSKTAAQHGDTTLIPLADLEAMLASVMAGREYLSQGPHMTRTEAGWEPPAPLPPDRGLRLSDFLSVIEGLPDPCPEPDAAMAVCQVIRDRGHRFLVTELEAEWESRCVGIPRSAGGPGGYP